jgi:hypothetical protein
VQKRQFMNAVAKIVADLKRGQGFRAGLRIKGVQGHTRVFEMTWADDGRARLAMELLPFPVNRISSGGVSARTTSCRTREAVALHLL